MPETVPPSSPFAAVQVSHAIFRVARAHKALAGRLLRDAGVYPGQELVLMTLWERGPQRQVDILEHVDSDAPSMTRSIARLEKAGLVRRSASPTDARVVIVEATPESLGLKDAVERAWGELERITVGDATDRQVVSILSALRRLEANLAEAPE